MYLDQTVKRTIIKNVLEYTFGKRIKVLQQQHRDLAQAVYDDHLRAFKRAISKLPRDLLNHSNHALVAFGGKRAYLYWEPAHVARYGWVDDSKVTQTFRPWLGKIVSYEARHPLSVRWEQWAQRSEKLEEEEDRLRAQLGASLDRVRTVKRLLDDWPEAKVFISDDLKKAAPLPAVQGPALNKLIQKAREAA